MKRRNVKEAAGEADSADAKGAPQVSANTQPAAAESSSSSSSSSSSGSPHLRNVVIALVVALSVVGVLFVQDPNILPIGKFAATREARSSAGFDAGQTPAAAASPSSGVKVFTEEELARFDGKGGSSPVLLSVLGEVFDVTKGRRFYGKDSDSHYNFFAGRDGSTAFVTGVFEEKEGVTPHDVMGMSDQDLLGVEHWRDFYRDSKEYFKVGVLYLADGLGYYDRNGNPNERHAELQKRLDAAHAVKKLHEEESKRNPSCNSQWAQGKGGQLWCENGRVPRLGSLTGGETRCACYEPHIAVANADKLKVYGDCDPKATACVTPP